MKIGSYLIVISTFLMFSCASNKSLESGDSNQDSIEVAMSEDDNTTSQNSERLTSDTEESSSEKVLTEGEQQAIFLEEQRIKAEKDAAEERKRLIELRESLANFEEESKENNSISVQEMTEKDKAPIAMKEEVTVGSADASDIGVVENTTTEQAKNVIEENTESPIDDYYAEGDIVIQFFASIHGDKNFSELSKFGKIIVQQVPERSLYRYNIGYFRNRIEAEIVLSEVRGIGWVDAFVREK